MNEPNLYIIAGCNGAGKTTASFTVLPELLECQEFINADEIARGLSPFKPEKAAIEAGKIMLNKIGELIKRQEDFAFETTLAGKSHIRIIDQARKYNYLITLVFFWLDSPELAIERVKVRVDSGGHNVSELIIRRRYKNGLQNLFQLYIPIVDYWMIFNNSRMPSEFIAEGFINKEEKIYNNDIFKLMKNTNNGKK